MSKFRIKPPEGYFAALILLIIIFSFVNPMYAQNSTRQVRGKVTDSKGNALIGVTVKLKGAANGASTDVQGDYSIQVADDKGVLIFTYLGYKSKEIAINSQSTVNAVLEDDNQQLEEIVVVAYGTQKKASVTGAVASIGSEDLNAVAVGDAASRLQGRIAGVTVTTSNIPGGTATVRVRGYGSLGNNNPLYVIDGIPRTDMDNINPNDIESMTVLKDASSSAIYGSRAANGVIVVTTRWGIAGPVLNQYLAIDGLRMPSITGKKFQIGQNEIVPIPLTQIDLSKDKNGKSALTQNPGY